MLQVESCWVVVVLDEPPPPQPAIASAQSARAAAARMAVEVLTDGASLFFAAAVKRLFLALALTGLLAGLAAQTAAASPVARAASFSPCDISGKQQNLGASYVTSLKVQGVGCTKAEKVITAYHQCRHQSGGPGGNCSKTVLGFKCKDGERTGVPNVQYDATAKCRKASDPSKRIKSAYTQNT
jgi:hypothetical protein